MTKASGALSRALVVLGLLIACTCEPVFAQALGCMPKEAPGFATPKAAKRDSLMVFIHGLHGDGRLTWTATGPLGGEIAAWPCLVLADGEIFAPTNVYLSSYRSEMGQTNPTIGEAARRITADLKAAEAFAYNHVTFIAHSMGGIVLARMLTDASLLAEEERRRIRLVVFLGTPALPTEAAEICARFDVNTQCQEMIDGSTMADLWKAWDEVSRGMPIWCFAEGANMRFLTAPVFGLRIVPEESAHRPCRVSGRKAIAHDLTHAQIVKPLSIGMDPHRDLRAAFAACIKPHLPLAAAAEERLVSETSYWFYQLKDRLLQDPKTNVETLRAHLASEQIVNRFWYPAGSGTPSFRLESYEPHPAPSFVLAIRDQLPTLLPRAEFGWVRSVSQVSEMLADGAFADLVRQLRDSRGLRQDDVILAVKPRVEVPGLTLLVLRPASSNSPAGSRQAAFGLLGVLVIPKPVESCMAAAAL